MNDIIKNNRPSESFKYVIWDVELYNKKDSGSCNRTEENFTVFGKIYKIYWSSGLAKFKHIFLLSKNDINERKSVNILACG